MTTNYLSLDNGWMDLQQVKNLLDSDLHLSIGSDASEKIEKCRRYLDEKLTSPDTLYYGINTGFGFLQNVRINHEELQQLQQNLLQ